MRLVAVSGGLSTPSSTRLLADRLTESTRDALAAAGHDVETEVIELRGLAVAVANNLVTGFPPPQPAAAVDAVTGADRLIAVTPVFTASYSGLFKSFFNLIDPDALAGKPVLVTARHSLVLEHALRPLFAYLRNTVAPHRGVRGVRGLGHRRRRVHHGLALPHPAGGRRAGRPGGRATGPGGAAGRHHRARTAALRPALRLRRSGPRDAHVRWLRPEYGLGHPFGSGAGAGGGLTTRCRRARPSRGRAARCPRLSWVRAGVCLVRRTGRSMRARRRSSDRPCSCHSRGDTP